METGLPTWNLRGWAARSEPQMRGCPLETSRRGYLGPWRQGCSLRTSVGGLQPQFTGTMLLSQWASLENSIKPKRLFSSFYLKSNGICPSRFWACLEPMTSFFYLIPCFWNWKVYTMPLLSLYFGNR